jgi:hypothetical protein
MIKYNLIIILAISIFTSCAAQKKEKISGDRDVISVTHTIDQPFNGLSIGNEFEVKIKQSQRNSYILTADKNLVDIVTFKVRDSVLYIETSRRITSSKRLEIYLNIEKIDKIELKNDVELKSDGQLESDNMTISSYDNSEFDLDVLAKNLGINLHGKSSGSLEGVTENLNVFMNDRSDLEAELKTIKSTINLQKHAEMDIEGEAENAVINLAADAKLKARNFAIETAEITLIEDTEANIKVSKTLTVFAKDKSVLNSYGKAELKTTLSDKVTLNKK